MPKNKPPTEKQVEEALRVIRADYYSDVLGLAEDLVQMVRDGEVSSTEEAQDRLHELVDGTQRVIYTYKAQQGLLASDNADAAFEEGLVDPGQFESDVPYGVLMYAAMERDVVERIDAGVRHDDWPDPFDDDTYEEDEEDEEYEDNRSGRARTVTLHARYSGDTASVRVIPDGDTVVLSKRQSSEAERRAGLASGDYWERATAPDGAEYRVVRGYD